MKVFYLDGIQIKELGTDKLYYQDPDNPKYMWKEVFRDYKDEGFIIMVVPQELREKIKRLL